MTRKVKLSSLKALKMSKAPLAGAATTIMTISDKVEFEVIVRLGVEGKDAALAHWHLSRK